VGHRTVILALGRLRQEDHEFKASLGYGKTLPQKAKRKRRRERERLREGERDRRM
jgi:hypothetical protein